MGIRPQSTHKAIGGEDMWWENYGRARAWYSMIEAVLAGYNEHPQAKAWFHEMNQQAKEFIQTREFAERVPMEEWQKAFEYNVRVFHSVRVGLTQTANRVAQVHKKYLAGDKETIKKYGKIMAY